MKPCYIFVGLLMAGCFWAGALRAESLSPCPAPPPADPALFKVLKAAKTSLDAGRAQKALALLSACAEAHPRQRHDLLSFLTGTAHYRLRHPARAEKAFMAAADLMPCRSEVWQSIAAVSCEQGNYGAAAAALSVAFRLAPPTRDEWRKLGDLYRLAGVPAEAARVYRRALGKDPEPAALDRLAGACLAAHDPEAALAAVRRAAEKAPTAKRWARIGQICFLLDQHEASLDAYRAAATLDDRDGRMSLMAGVAAMKLARPTDAEYFFSRALQSAAPKSDTAESAARGLAALQPAQKKSPFS
jgi:tetratricopeptide (TPR) repeat protein